MTHGEEEAQTEEKKKRAVSPLQTHQAVTRSSTTHTMAVRPVAATLLLYSIHVAAVSDSLVSVLVLIPYPQLAFSHQSKLSART